MELLDQYLSLQQQIFDYFGYVEDWAKIPIDDRREYQWSLNQNRNGSDTVIWGADLSASTYDSDDYYLDPIYTQRHLPKWVYRGSEYTMICVDTGTDLNRVLAIFSSAKERSRETVEHLME
jgi:hypothetical protein